MAEKFKTTRLSPIRVAVVTKKYNKHPKNSSGSYNRI